MQSSNEHIRTSEQAVVFDNVRFSYAQRHEALRGISLNVAWGEFVAVLGANGSGKSTLAKHINALLVPSSGTVIVGGNNTQTPGAELLVRRMAGMVFQNPDNQAVASVVRDDVAFGPENLGLPREEIIARVDEALESVGMQQHALDDISSLSGGQKQLVAIAGVLAMRPQILVLDEPGAMLDVRGRKAITRIAHELNQQGMTIILITHFMEEALEADRVIVLDEGEIALQGTPKDVFTQTKRLRELRLGLPFVVELSCQLQELGVPVGVRLSEESLEDELCSLNSNR